MVVNGPHTYSMRLRKNLENIIAMMNTQYDDLSTLQADALVGAFET